MPQIELLIGGRSFHLACEEGQEASLQQAAALLDGEAQELIKSTGRLDESRLLLMSGVMLADKTIELGQLLAAKEAELTALRTQIATLQSAPGPEPERIEVPVIPQAVSEALAEIAARAEALANQVEGRD